MTSNNRKRIINAVSILAIGAIMTGGGLFLWQNQFTLNLTPQASTQELQSVVMLGEKSDLVSQSYGQLIALELDAKTPQALEFIDRAEIHPPIASPRDQAVLAYEEMAKPVSGHIYYVLMLGKNDWVTGLEKRETIATMTARVRKQVSDLVELLSARPGVLPRGFTIFLAAYPDPLKGTGELSKCGATMPQVEKEYAKEANKEITKTIEALKVLYPEYIEVISTNSTFSNHTLFDTTPWFSNCLNLNEAGEAEVARQFLVAISAAQR